MVCLLKIALLAAFTILLSTHVFAGNKSEDSSDAVVATLNDLTIAVDAQTGAIVKMEYPGPGVMLESGRENASAIDLAYPIEEYDALRLAARYSNSPRITKTDNSLTIYWGKLGMSREFDLAGSVSAQVKFEASSDGRSVIMTSEIENKSQIPVRQVIFPDFYGLQPTGGIDSTIFKTCSFGSAPFRELQMNEDRRSLQFCHDAAYGAVEYKPGGMFGSMTGRWMDLSSLKGGFSLFPKRWGWDPQVTVRLHLSEFDQTLRLLCVHPIDIQPGGKWESGQFILTPHKSGWAKGIEVYRDWIKQNIKREYPVPEHVRKGVGYRTAWMITPSGDLSWRIKDLQALAKESKEHGLDEMVLWGWDEKAFHLPLTPPHPKIGTEQEFVDVVAKCKEIGVNVVPFISVVQVTKHTAAKYGVTVPETGGWTQGLNYIPRFQPPYTDSLVSAGVDVTNKVWQQEVLDSCKHLIDIGIPSLSWDQFWTTNQPEPNMLSLTRQIRQMAKKADPESTFSGEELWNIELDSCYLDYTWNWGGYADWQGLTNAFPAPRRNCCVSSDPLVVKRAFLDNLYLNVFPRKAGGVNGSDYITNWPELSAALKQCAKLRNQFLPYFLDGHLVGNCLLSEPCPAAHISGYVMPDKALMLVLNLSPAQPLDLSIDLSQWLTSDSGDYQVKYYNGDGELLDTLNRSKSKWNITTPTLAAHEIAVYEILPK